jgi:hypothetical protein
VLNINIFQSMLSQLDPDDGPAEPNPSSGGGEPHMLFDGDHQ